MCRNYGLSIRTDCSTSVWQVTDNKACLVKWSLIALWLFLMWMFVVKWGWQLRVCFWMWMCPSTSLCCSFKCTKISDCIFSLLCLLLVLKRALRNHLKLCVCVYGFICVLRIGFVYEKWLPWTTGQLRNDLSRQTLVEPEGKDSMIYLQMHNWTLVKHHLSLSLTCRHSTQY